MDKTLTNLSDLLFGGVPSLKLLDVLATTYLFFLLNLLIVLNESYLIRINESIIFANFPEKNHFILRRSWRDQESFVKLEKLSFDILWNVDVMATHISY